MSTGSPHSLPPCLPPCFLFSPFPLLPYLQEGQHPLPDNDALCMQPHKDGHKLSRDRRGLHGLKHITENGDPQRDRLLLSPFGISLAAADSFDAGPTGEAEAEAPAKGVKGGSARNEGNAEEEMSAYAACETRDKRGGANETEGKGREIGTTQNLPLAWKRLPASDLV